MVTRAAMAAGRARETRRHRAVCQRPRRKQREEGWMEWLPAVSASERSGGIKAKNTGLGRRGASGRAGVWLDEEGMGTG